MATSIAIAVVEYDDRFLVGQRPAGVPLAGLWEFPGGKIEPGESPEAAAVRECLEEAGIAVEPLFRYPSQRETYDHGQVELHFVACRLISPDQSAPHGGYRWVNRNVLAHCEFPRGNRELLQWLCGEPPGSGCDHGIDKV